MASDFAHHATGRHSNLNTADWDSQEEARRKQPAEHRGARMVNVRACWTSRNTEVESVRRGRSLGMQFAAIGALALDVIRQRSQVRMNGWLVA